MGLRFWYKEAEKRRNGGHHQETVRPVRTLTEDERFRVKECSAIMEHPDTALKLITQAERVAYRVFAENLQAHLWVVYGPDDLKALRRQGVTEAVYTSQEIAELRKLPKGALKTIHEAKEIFPMATIEEVKENGRH